MIQTKTCLYCGTPFIGTSFTCSRWDCPSKQIKTYTYCSPPCDKLKELDARLKEIEQRELDDRIAIGIASDKIIKLEDKVKEMEDRLVNHWINRSDLPRATLEDWFLDHIQKYHSIQYPPKTVKGRFDPDTHLPYDTKPTPTDEELVEKYAEEIYGGTDMDKEYKVAVKDILRQLIAEVRKGDKP